MLAEIAQAGFAISCESDKADVVVINTCGFIAPAEAESLEAIRHAVNCKRRGSVKKVIVAGCAGRMGSEVCRLVAEQADMELVGGVYPKVMQEGTVDVGAWSCGMVAGLIHDIPTCKELIDRIMSEAEQLIRKRLEGFLAA